MTAGCGRPRQRAPAPKAHWRSRAGAGYFRLSNACMHGRHWRAAVPGGALHPACCGWAGESRHHAAGMPGLTNAGYPSPSMPLPGSAGAVFCRLALRCWRCPGVAGRSLAALARPAVPETAWQALAAKIGGGVLRPGDRGFRVLTRPQNLRYDRGEPVSPARAMPRKSPPRWAERARSACRWCCAPAATAMRGAAPVPGWSSIPD